MALSLAILINAGNNSFIEKVLNEVLLNYPKIIFDELLIILFIKQLLYFFKLLTCIVSRITFYMWPNFETDSMVYIFCVLKKLSGKNYKYGNITKNVLFLLLKIYLHPISRHMSSDEFLRGV